MTTSTFPLVLAVGIFAWWNELSCWEFVNGFVRSLWVLSLSLAGESQHQINCMGTTYWKPQGERKEPSHRLLVQKCLDGIFTKTFWHTLLLGGAKENQRNKNWGERIFASFPFSFLPLANTAKCLNKHEQSVYFHLRLSRKSMS